MTEVLARVTSRTLSGPRGPDVAHRVRVKREWLARGGVVELELPRNLACACCGGGGCDACERSGAISLRGREEPAECVAVTLPARPECAGDSRGITLRIPEQGGLPAEGSELPRGVLLLTVVPSDDADPSVKLVPAPSPVTVEEESGPPRSGTRPVVALRSVALLLVLVLAWVLLLIWLRLSGRG